MTKILCPLKRIPHTHLTCETMKSSAVLQLTAMQTLTCSLSHHLCYGEYFVGGLWENPLHL